LLILEIDECISDTHGCQNSATCINTPGSYTCACTDGWTGDLCELGRMYIGL